MDDIPCVPIIFGTVQKTIENYKLDRSSWQIRKLMTGNCNNNWKINKRVENCGIF